MVFFPTVMWSLACGDRPTAEAGENIETTEKTIPPISSAAASSPANTAHPKPEVWPMPTPPDSGLPNPQSYEVLSEAVVRDLVTELQWQRVASLNFFNWQNALAYCDELTLDGYSDWRLPSRLELLSILSLSAVDPAIDQTAFPNTASDWFWSKDERGCDAWYVYFYLGYPNFDSKSGVFSVRCVRQDIPEPALDPASRYDLEEQVAYDRWTGLLWQRQDPHLELTFQEASSYCTNLELGDRTDWRAPTMLELQTLVQLSESEPAVDLAVFPETQAVPFWSGSPWVEAPELRGWYVDFATGAALYLIGSTAYDVRCVADATMTN